MSLYNKHRPTKLTDVVGQSGIVNSLKGLVKAGVPHAVLFTGPSGCGKTTVARIVAARIKCHPSELVEVNAANKNGVDLVREIDRNCRLSPLLGQNRVWILDECHQLTQQAQNALLKLLEDPPPHAYFFLATTDPAKVIKTIKTRCTHLDVKPLSGGDVEALVTKVAKAEGVALPEETVEAIADVAEGSARKCLVLLEQVLHIENPEEQLEAITAADGEAQAIDLCRLLLDKRSKWKDIAEVVKTVTTEPESVRYAVLNYMATVVLSGGPKAAQANNVIIEFSDSFMYTKRAGLASACYNTKYPDAS